MHATIGRDRRQVTSISIVKRLIYKDWYFNRTIITLLTIGGLIALTIFGVSHGPIRIIAAVLFIGAASVLIFTPIWTVLGERREQTLAFLMSLPVSIKGYTVAKVVGTMLSGLCLWLILIVVYVMAALFCEPIAAGSIPPMMVIFGALLVIFCLNLGTALVTEGDKPTLFVTIVSNLCFWFFWSFFYNVSFITPDLRSPTIVWHPEIVWMLAMEAIAVGALLSVTFYLQSRKTDFI